MSCILYGVGDSKNKLILRPLFFLGILSFFNMDSFYTPAGLEQLTMFLSAILFVYHFHDKIGRYDINDMIFFMQCSLFIQCAVVGMNYFGVNPFNFGILIDRPVGALGQESLSAALIAVLSPSLLYKSSKKWLLVPFIALLLLNTTFGILSFLGGILFYLGYKRLYPCVLYTVIGLCFVFLFLIGINLDGVEFFNDKGRFDLWLEVLRNFKEWDLSSQLFGRGLGYVWHNFTHVTDIDNKPFRYFHNEYLELLYAFGSVGVFLVGWMMKPLLKVKFDEQSAILLSIIFAIIINSAGNFTLHIAPIGLIFLIVYSCLITKTLEGKDYGNNCNEISSDS